MDDRSTNHLKEFFFLNENHACFTIALVAWWREHGHSNIPSSPNVHRRLKSIDLGLQQGPISSPNRAILMPVKRSLHFTNTQHHMQTKRKTKSYLRGH